MIYINNKEKVNNLKESTNFYIITDFDRTLTTRESEPSMGIIPQYLGGECLKKRTEIFEYYRPLELDYNIPPEKKTEIMKEWAQKSFALLSNYINKDLIHKSLENANIHLREGVKKFFVEMKNKNIPVIVMSAGVGNIVKEFLQKENCLFDNVEIIANFFEFKDGKPYIDFDNIIAVSKKEYKIIPENIKNKIEGKDAFLFGDLVEDIKMVDSNKIENTLTFGFLDANIEENIDRFNNKFDVVLAENEDFKSIKQVLNF